ncbi:hypothetical protein, partial [Sporosarcina sp. ZBG7A]|uniref:hypothetical protein n=1 Tax=Sporosarcina sp. ZBG7A TaxID=1582223 RepID=UPI001E5D7B0C
VLKTPQKRSDEEAEGKPPESARPERRSTASYSSFSDLTLQKDKRNGKKSIRFPTLLCKVWKVLFYLTKQMFN